MKPSARTGLLLVNLGTPDAPEAGAVRRYLREFLSDPRVIDIHPVLRWLLLEAVILPRRPRVSAAAYRKVWRPDGSPLLVHGRALRDALARELGGGFEVALGMRYGTPSIERAMGELEAAGVSRIVVLPLYAHEASSSTGTALEEVFRVASSRWNVPCLAVVPPFHDDAGFLEALREVTAGPLAAFAPDRVLFSFHGLPERHVRKADVARGACLATPGCCEAFGDGNRHCYRAQCYETARRLAAALELEAPWSVAFQSRLGRTPWIAPYTDHVVRELAASGVRRLAVVCPGFAADCLETLEEIGIRAREDFLAHGGKDLLLVPCLNAHPAWVAAAASLARRAAFEDAG